MELLLILSAMLSAATGAFTGTRGPEAAPRHEAAVEAVAVAQSAVAIVAPAAKLSAAAPTVSKTAPDLRIVAEAPPSRAALDTDRLIE